MKTTAVVGEKGQVTIPKGLRDALGIVPGSELEFADHNGRLVARRVVSVDPLLALVGAGKGRNADEMLTALRGPGWIRPLDGK